MSKPTLDDTRWAITGGGADAANLTAPASGEKDTGYVTNQIPTSGKLNWLFRKIHAWFIWLSSTIFITRWHDFTPDAGWVPTGFTGWARNPLAPNLWTASNSIAAQCVMCTSQFGLIVGETIDAVRVHMNNSGGASVTLTLLRTTFGGGDTVIATANTTTNGDQILVATCGTPEVVGDAVAGYKIKLISGSGGAYQTDLLTLGVKKGTL